MIPPWLPNGLVESGEFFIKLSIELVPLFLFAGFLVGLAEEYVSGERIKQLLSGHSGARGNVLAAGVGSVTPFCSCASIPVLAGLLGAGVPLGISFSFLIASPLINEIAILLLLGVFGLKVTVLYVSLTFIAAVIGGLVIGRLRLDSHVKVTPDAPPVRADGGECGDVCVGSPVQKTHKERLGSASRRAIDFLVETGPYLVLGLAIAALIHGIVPVAWLHSLLGPENPFAVPLAAIAGAPIYSDVSVMLPVASGLATQGIPIGTVLAFVIGSAGISVPTLVPLGGMLDRYLLGIYTVMVVSVGIVVGMILNLIPL